jgi:L-lactate dehydrogenase
LKIGVVGCGFVGSTAAYALVMRGVGREIVMVDLNKQRAIAEADDIRHAVPFAHAMEINAGGYEDLAGCHAVIVCAGVGQKPGESRLQLLQRNAVVFRDVIPSILKWAPDAILIIATNPVDVMTHLAAKIAAEHGLPAGRVFGSGTTLDTARFRALLGSHCGVDPHHVHGYVVGEHGDSEVLTWSLVTVGGMPLPAFCEMRGIDLSDSVRAAIDEKVRRAAYTIIAEKGATYYGIGCALARIVESVIHDQRSILTVCAPTADAAGIKDVTLALPRLIGGTGVMEAFPLPLKDEELVQYRKSAEILRRALDELGI